MREIKLKAKRVDNGKWVEGDLMYDDYNSFGAWISSTYDGERLRALDIGNKITTFRGYEVIPETVGRYTGVKDKNGKEIFEGDKVRLVWGECCRGIYEVDETVIISMSDYSTLEMLSNCIECEVIGNIHDKEDIC